MTVACAKTLLYVMVVLQGCLAVSAFCGQHNCHTTLQIPAAVKTRVTVIAFQSKRMSSSWGRQRHVLQLSGDNDNPDADNTLYNEKDPSSDDPSGFDGEGFAGYLAPYAVALLGSIAVTFAVFKFFLLDY